VSDWIIWVAAGLALLIAEMLLPGVFMMWLGLAACGAGLLTLIFQSGVFQSGISQFDGFRFGFEAQVVSFGVLAVVALSIGLRLQQPRQIIHTEREGLIGRPATALVFHGRDGRVRLGDTDWAARVPADISPPDPGTRLRVAQVEGTTLIVRPDG
jgi:membrane protein implicated in regulation of membrane protease activity